MYKKAFNRLPDNYARENQINNEKFHKVIYGELEEVKKALQDVKNYQNMDLAIGKTLDHIGKNVLELRNTDDDNVYRDFIKTKIIANLSKGDIETINYVASFLLKDNYKGLSETWNNALYDDIAGLVMGIEPNESYSFANSPLNRVKAGGVKLYFQAMMPEENIIIDEKNFMYKARYDLCNEVKTKDRLVHSNMDNIKILENMIKIRSEYPLSGRIRTKSSEGNIQNEDMLLKENSFKSRVHYPVAGISICGGGR